MVVGYGRLTNAQSGNGGVVGDRLCVTGEFCPAPFFGIPKMLSKHQPLGAATAHIFYTFILT